MNLISNLPTFIASIYLLAMIPGQGTAMILRQTLLFGSKIGALTVLSYTAGFAIWGALSAIGLAGIFTESPTAYSILKYVGVAYLLFLSFQGFMRLSKNTSKFDFSKMEKILKATPFKTGMTTSLTNAKAAVIAVAFLPAFVPEDFNLALGIFILGCIWSLTSMCWYLPLVFSIGKASNFFANPNSRKVLTLISCFGLLVLAFLLAIS
jgi:threonine/homoserine/homoserine lactone efflux protein